MSSKLPNEIALRIAKLVGQESTLDLKPLVLVNRQFHDVVAPVLLATISVSSLGKVVELCDQIISACQQDDNVHSSIAKHTKTIVISGVIWENDRADSHIGLEDLGEQPPGEQELAGSEPVGPDINMPPQEISDKIRTALPHLTSLDGLEWYGRFAGDYHLVRYLQGSKVIRHLAYGIDMFVSSVSPAYYNNAFLFEGLESLTITTEYEPEDDMFPHIVQMMHRNPGLRSILFDCKYAESMSGRWSLLDLICDNASPDKPIFVWPDLQHLVLRFFQGSLWQSAEEVELLARFLVAHPKLETLYLYETCLEDSESETAQPLSLASHPDSLPSLKRLLGSPRLIAGVLESPAACSSVEAVIDKSEEGFDSDGAKAPYIDRILNALEKVPENRLWRLRLEIPQLNRQLYTKLAQLAPKIEFLEFLRPMDVDSTAPQDKEFNPAVDIPSGLNEFPKLEVIGIHIARDFVGAVQGGPDGYLELARKVPRLKSIHRDGALATFVRNSDGTVSLSEEDEYTDNRDYDWVAFEVDWRHRPMSRRAIKQVRESDGITSELR